MVKILRLSPIFYFLVTFLIQGLGYAQQPETDTTNLSDRALVSMLTADPFLTKDHMAQSRIIQDQGRAQMEIMFRGRNEEIISELTNACGSCPERQRVLVVEVLRKFRAVGSSPTLMGMLDLKNVMLDSEILKALRTFLDPRTLPGLEDFYNKVQGTPVRSAVVYTLGYFKPLSMASDLKKDLTSSDPGLVMSAAGALAKMGDRSGHSIVLGYLDSKERYIQDPAVRTLGEMGDPRDRPLIENMDRSSPENYVVKMALFDMMVLNTSEDQKVKTLVDYLDRIAADNFDGLNRVNHDPIIKAIELLEDSHSPEAVRQLAKMINDNRFFAYQMDIANGLTLNGKKLTWKIQNVKWGGAYSAPGYVFDVK